ncbi:hypothetical protein NFI96_014244 [Prochilodus magdalenae]|nr:hypothetical protein NFI96_014244 [Prochilodus magdalenae]
MVDYNLVSKVVRSYKLLIAQDNDPKHTSRLCKGYLTKKESDGVLRIGPEPNRDGLGRCIYLLKWYKCVDRCGILGKNTWECKSCQKEMDLSNNYLQDSEVETLFAVLIRSHCELEILKSSGTANSC